MLQWMREGKQAGKDYVLVDLRRNDHEGGTIKGSLNLPAQSLYYSLSTVYNLLRAGGVKYIIWYCGMWFLIWPLGPDVLCLALVDKSILID